MNYLNCYGDTPETITEAVRQLTGGKPETLSDIVRSLRRPWEGNGHIYDPTRMMLATAERIEAAMKRSRKYKPGEQK